MATQGSRMSSLFSTLPLTTTAMITLNVVLQLVQYAAIPNIAEFAISPYYVIYLGQYYRVVTSSFFHGSLSHIAMNMLSFSSFAPPLEQMMGTITFFLVILVFALLGNIMYLAICWTAAMITKDISWIQYTSVGFSGVLFGLAMVESACSTNPTRSIFGLITVPTKYYPWILMIVLQALLPNVSFVGHLCGILCGLLLSMGMLNWTLPSKSCIEYLDKSSWLSKVTSRPNFLLRPEIDPQMFQSSSCGIENISRIWQRPTETNPTNQQAHSWGQGRTVGSTYTRVSQTEMV